MSSLSKKFIKSGFALYIIQIMNIVAPLLVLPFLTRVLTVDNFGQLSIFISICGLAYVVNDFGFNLSATYLIAKNEHNRYKISIIISSIYKAKLILFFLCGLSIWLYLERTDIFTEKYMFFFFVIVFFCQSYQPVWLFQGIEKMKHITLTLVISRLSYIVFIFIFINGNNDLRFVFISYCFSQFLGMVVSNYLLFKEGYVLTNVNNKRVLDNIKYSFDFFLSRASVSIYTTASALIIGSISGQQQAALYSAAEKLYQAMQSFTGPISQALFPLLTKESNHKFFIKTIAIVLIPLLFVTTLISFFSTEILTIVFGEAYRESSPILQIFCIIVVINYLGSNFGYPAFSALKKVSLVNKTVMFGSLIQVLSLLYLYIVNDLNALNLAKALLATELVIMVLRVSLYLYIKNKSR